MVDSATLAKLRRDADVGRTHRERELVAAAIRDGRIPPASRETWLSLLAVDPAAEQTLAKLRKGTIPVTPLGYSSDDDTDLYSDLYGH